MIQNSSINPRQQVENLRQAYGLLETVLHTDELRFVDALSQEFMIDDVDPFLLLDVLANGSALDLLQLLHNGRGDPTETILRAAAEAADEYVEEELVEDWDKEEGA